MPKTSFQGFAEAVITSSSGGFSTASGSPVAVTNLSAAVVNNRAVSRWRISLKSDGSGNQSSVGLGGGGSADNSATVTIRRNGVDIATLRVRNFQGTVGGYNFGAGSAIEHEDVNPPTGTNTYEIFLNTGAGLAYCEYCVMTVVQVR